MFEKRKTYPRILKRAMKKLKRFGDTQLYGYLTPAENACVLQYFGKELSEYQKWKLSNPNKPWVNRKQACWIDVDRGQAEKFEYLL